MRKDQRGWRAPLAFSAVAWIALLAVPVSFANPMPPAGFMIHIRAAEGDACAAPPVAHCAEIVQYTEATGPLEFDLFAYPWAFAGWQTLYSVSVDLQWPVSWSLLDWELCPGPEATIECGPSHALLHFVWPDCPAVPENGLVLLGHWLFDVDAHGVLWAEPTEGGIVMGCPPMVEEAWGVPGRAEAGVVCDYCYNQCNLNSPCEPHFPASTLDVELAPGRTCIVPLDLALSGWGEEGLCCYETQLVSEEPWLSGWVECADPSQGTACVSLDATQLSPGIYEGTLAAIADCVGCLAVTLTVAQAQGVPEGPAEPPGDEPAPPVDGEGSQPEDAIAISWGRLKGLFE